MEGFMCEQYVLWPPKSLAMGVVFKGLKDSDPFVREFDNFYFSFEK